VTSSRSRVSHYSLIVGSINVMINLISFHMPCQVQDAVKHLSRAVSFIDDIYEIDTRRADRCLERMRTLMRAIIIITKIDHRIVTLVASAIPPHVCDRPLTPGL